MAESNHQPGGYETRDVSVKLFGMMILGLVVITLMGMAISLWFFNRSGEKALARDVPPPPLATTLPAEPPEPRLQVPTRVTPNPDFGKEGGMDLQDLAREKTEQERTLHEYALVDAQGGIVRIPIERAMDLIAERGLPVRGETAPAPAKRGGRP